MSLSEKDIKKLNEKYGHMKMEGKFNKGLEKTFDNIPIKIKEVKKALKIKDADIAEMFGYKNAVSYRNSERRHHIENGIIEIYKLTQIK